MRLTCSANCAESREGLVERGEEVSELVQLFRGQVPEGRHDAWPDFDRADDRRAGNARGDVGQVRPRTVIAVLAELVAGEAAGPGDDLLAELIARRHLHLDLGRRTADRAEVGE